ncbi:MAG: hypothetical protein MI864_20150, partial [Pseudomonadales bacterium]|nr:hypothetical protein [Pseudomonadales bacterium]
MRRDKTSIRGDKTRQVRNHCLFLLPVTLLAACASQNPAPENSTQNTPTSLISTNQMTDSMPTSGPENAHNTDLIDIDESVTPSRSIQKEQPNMTILVIENQEQANQEVARLAYNMEREAQKQQTPNDIEET